MTGKAERVPRIVARVVDRRRVRETCREDKPNAYEQRQSRSLEALGSLSSCRN